MAAIKTPFANSGTRAPIPESSLDGSISMVNGYSSAYELLSTDPNHKLIDRTTFNQLMYLVSSAIKEIQELGAAPWFSDLAPYALNAYVSHGGKMWRSATGGNTSVPGVNTDWQAIGSAAFAEVVQSTGSSTSDVMSQDAVTDGLNAKLNSNKVVQAAGTSTTDVMSQKAVTDKLFGYGQAWQDVTSSRELNTNYTNTTGKPIFVSWHPGSTTGGAASVSILVGGSTRCSAFINSETFNVNTLSTIVPIGATYRFSVATGTVQKGFFWEYR